MQPHHNKKRPYKLIHGLARKEALILQYRNRNLQENGYPILFIIISFDAFDYIHHLLLEYNIQQMDDHDR